MNCVKFAKMDQVFSLRNWYLKTYWINGKKYWKSQGILSVRKSGNPALVFEARRVAQSLAQYYSIGNTCTELDRFIVKFDTCINFKLGVIYFIFFLEKV